LHCAPASQSQRCDPKRPEESATAPLSRKGPSFTVKETVLVDVLVHLPICKKKSPPERSSSLAAVKRSGVTAKPEVVVAFDAQFEEFIESRFAGGHACANLRLHLIVVTSCAWKPMRAKRSAEGGERPETRRKLAACLSLGRGVRYQTALWHAHQSSLDAQPSCNRRSAAEERALGGRMVTAEISKIPIGKLRAGPPSPAAIHNGMRFQSSRSAAHVQVCQRRARAKKVRAKFQFSLRASA